MNPYVSDQHGKTICTYLHLIRHCQKKIAWDECNGSTNLSESRAVGRSKNPGVPTCLPGSYGLEKRTSENLEFKKMLSTYLFPYICNYEKTENSKCLRL